jgi:hypothetical protein
MINFFILLNLFVTPKHIFRQQRCMETLSNNEKGRSYVSGYDERYINETNSLNYSD